MLDTPADNLTEQAEGDSKKQELPAVPDMGPSEEAGFTVKIQAPGTEPTDFQVKACHLWESLIQTKPLSVCVDINIADIYLFICLFILGSRCHL